MLEIIEGFVYQHRPWRAEAGAPAPVGGFNVAPTQQVPLVMLDEGAPVLSSARWWLVPHWLKGELADWKATTFNAKIETAFEKPTFRTAWTSGRCLIPAIGYYEWTGPKTNKQPHFIQPQHNHALTCFAGLQTQRLDGLRTCTILTRPALPELEEIHPRMPVMLTPEEAELWLDRKAPDTEIRETFGAHWQGRMTTRRVARFGSRDDGPELIEPADLFG